MNKFRFFLDFHKEERWLEHLASQGWRLKKQSIVYTFEPAPPEQANIKIDFRIFKKKQDFIDYRSLFEDSGWRHISGTKNSGNQYFMKTGGNGGEDIFSDASSRAERYKRLSYMMLFFCAVFIPLFTNSMSRGTSGLDTFMNPKALYFTPGLWELSGFEFWRKFLFETPFALMRGFSWGFSLLFFFAYIFLTLKAWILYRKAVNTDSE